MYEKKRIAKLSVEHRAQNACTAEQSASSRTVPRPLRPTDEPSLLSSLSLSLESLPLLDSERPERSGDREGDRRRLDDDEEEEDEDADEDEEAHDDDEEEAEEEDTTEEVDEDEDEDEDVEAI